MEINLIAKEPAWDWPRPSAYMLQLRSLVFLWNSLQWEQSLSLTVACFCNPFLSPYSSSERKRRGWAKSHCNLICYTGLYSWGAHLYMKKNSGRGVNEGRRIGKGTRRRGGRENFGWALKTKNEYTHTNACKHFGMVLWFCAQACRCLWRPKECMRASRAGVTRSCEKQIKEILSNIFLMFFHRFSFPTTTLKFVFSFYFAECFCLFQTTVVFSNLPHVLRNAVTELPILFIGIFSSRPWYYSYIISSSLSSFKTLL